MSDKPTLREELVKLHDYCESQVKPYRVEWALEEILARHPADETRTLVAALEGAIDDARQFYAVCCKMGEPKPSDAMLMRVEIANAALAAWRKEQGR